MSEKTIEGNGKGFLVLLLPISFVIIFLVTAWKFLLSLLVLLIALNVWQQYQWQQWCQRVNPTFSQLLRENQGKITPVDLAMRGNFPGAKAKRYLDSKASEFGASILPTEEGGEVYYFITGNVLGNILDSSEPVKPVAMPPLTQEARSLLAPPPPTPEPIAAEPEEELPAPAVNQAAKPDLAKQLVFGSLIQSELAKRLNVYSSTVYKRRNDPDFPEWSRSRDPDGIAWTFEEKTKEFFPLEENEA
ncbi:hypothetical protein [Anabaena sp. CA = ATCC 33047]|uniref:hypothetical protein n=1 Tax=Anabaena sp. (strain CA / ATCC 33047) TaxID=52271 RepID=UPI00082F1061|nr:hypothetical protein [Anabaena sp. CA = ATCC 33047]